MSEYGKRHYAENKDAYKLRAYANNIRYRNDRASFVNAIKESKPCLDCGEFLPAVCMDFDHLIDKSFNVSRLVKNGSSEKRILEEIAKCELVCSNCHRIRTYARLVERKTHGAQNAALERA